MDIDRDLTGLRALGGFFVLRTGGPPHSRLPTLAQAYSGTHTAQSVGFYGDSITFRIRKVAENLRTPEPRVAASVTQQALAARLWSVALGAAALYGELPDLDPRLLHWDPDASAPDDLWLSELRMLPVTAVDDVMAVVVTGHLVPLIDTLSARHRVSDRLLWGNAGSALAGTVRQIDRWARAHHRPQAAARVRALADGLLGRPGLAGSLDPATLRRRSCCLYYRVPGGGLCGDCCFDRRPGLAPRS
ncbi:(2Fe-2S)-binding protein [Streptomyces cavernae]|uniref:(2Fe-2S)-binding protein n=1 Tax=Streptomyces cavernae TaxID=2259034 RepID=UPI000FEBF351|nr:(2Fe-2S)-binding protein [Streptomyces cavernae]